MEEVLTCIHGLEFDCCADCYSKPVEQIKEEVDRNSKVFNWREKVFVSGSEELPEVDFDFDYDYDMDVDSE